MPEQDQERDSVRPRGDRFAKVEGRVSVDYLLRTAQQHHVQISAMADTKANILITVSSIILTLTLAQLDHSRMKAALLTLCGFTLVSLILAILAILPKFRKVEPDETSLPENFNLLFFGHFTTISRERFLDEIADALEEDSILYETLARDLYSLGVYLDRFKYRYLRWSYLALLVGFVVASIVSLLTIFS